MDRVLLGHITGVYGLKGWVKVHSDTNPRENIVSYSRWWLEKSGQWSQISVTGGRSQGKTIVAGLQGVSSPEQASSLIGATIAIDRDQLPVLAENEFYWADLVGMQVQTVGEMVIGPVSRMFETGANDVMVVQDLRGNADVETEYSAGKSAALKEILVPWLVPSVITEVDIVKRVITIDWDPDF